MPDETQPALTIPKTIKSTMKITCIRDAKDLQTLENEWNALLRESSSDSVFLTWEWISTWWEIFGSAFSLRVLAARDEQGALLGIAPLMIGREKILGRTFRALMIIGQKGDTLAEYLDFFIRKGTEAIVANEFLAYIQTELRPEWDLLFFERILSESPNLGIIRQQLGGALIDGELKSPFVTLPVDSWSEFLASKSRNFRSQWNNSWNRLMKQGAVEFQFAGKEIGLKEAMHEVARLHRQRWGEKSNSFKTEKYLAFHDLLSRRLHEKGWLVLMLIAVNGEPVAARYDFCYGGKVWCIQGGWNDAYDHMRVGTILTGKVIEWAIDHGQSEYDFLGGDSDYKRRWSDGERVMVNVTFCNIQTWRGRVCHLLRCLVSLKGRIKKVIPKFLLSTIRKLRQVNAAHG